jgi:hypothetical protein
VWSTKTEVEKVVWAWTAVAVSKSRVWVVVKIEVKQGKRKEFQGLRNSYIA